MMFDDLHFKCIFHKQSESGSEAGSEIKAKVGSGSEKSNFGSTTLLLTPKDSRQGIMFNISKCSVDHINEVCTYSATIPILTKSQVSVQLFASD